MAESGIFSGPKFLLFSVNKKNASGIINVHKKGEFRGVHKNTVNNPVTNL
jgi:hypothetical protein